MIDRTALLADLKALVTTLEDDLRGVIDEADELREDLALEHGAAVNADRTAMSFEGWLNGELTQAAVAWVLACVFVRFLEAHRGPVGVDRRPVLEGEVLAELVCLADDAAQVVLQGGDQGLEVGEQGGAVDHAACP